jgi:hypothetical protein
VRSFLELTLTADLDCGFSLINAVSGYNNLNPNFLPATARLWHMSNAFMALIWWVIPALGLIAAITYVVWVTKFEGKYRAETNRSVDSFQKFQQTFGSKDSNGPGQKDPTRRNQDESDGDYPYKRLNP